MDISTQLNPVVAEEIRVRGTVQGVGFRPTVYRLAKACGLRGDVCNDGQGVLIRAVGSRDALDTFVERLRAECPPLARMTAISRHPDSSNPQFTEFAIATSHSSTIRTEIAPDAATCPTCQAEIFDSSSRWYRYPFTNCTHCGPRLSIIQALPYDRRYTSMAGFPMCSECKRDYENPTNRRFHAQPTACPRCGPKVWLERADGNPTPHPLSALDAVDAAATLIQQGQIVAIKGLGGFHLACDATNEAVVQRLRQRKRRPDKPLALMARDIDIVAEYCTPSSAEREVLQSPAAPIVLMRATGAKSVATAVAPQQNVLGFMLPYTPLHHLILKPLNVPIVLTSGNLSDEPQCIDNDDARRLLAGIADYFLFHNRDIVNRVDDSVVRVSGKADLQILRRARGYAPAPIPLPEGFQTAPPILAMGSELKNTFCLLREGQVILSQHLGDLANAAAFEAYRDTLNLYLSLLEHHPTAIATDSHPEYLSTKLGKELAAANALPLHSIQHHHAHIAACLAENGLPLNTPPVLGIALDGLGYGNDGTFWGGEFLFADYREFKRLGTFKPVAMLGGERAIYQPWRSLYAHLRQAFGDELNLELFNFLQAKPLPLLNQMLEKNINAPLASSGGRLFDAVAAAVGICRESCSYEGQGAIALEALAESYMLNHPEETQGYPFTAGILEREGQPALPYIEPRPMWQALIADLRQNAPQSLMAARFHCGLADAIASMVARIHRSHRAIEQVALTGGVFQNQILLQEVRDRLTPMHLQVLTHSQIPPNDGGLSLGQAAIAAARTQSPIP